MLTAMDRFECVQNELELEAGERRTAFKDLREVGDNLLAACHLFARQEWKFFPRPLHPPPGGRAIESCKLVRCLRSSTENRHTR